MIIPYSKRQLIAGALTRFYYVVAPKGGPITIIDKGDSFLTITDKGN